MIKVIIITKCKDDQYHRDYVQVYQSTYYPNKK